MNCSELRRTLGADPNHISPAATEHRAHCPACEQYAQETLRLNGLIRRALEIRVTAERLQQRAASSGGATTDFPSRSFSNSRRRWFAMAASVVLAVGVSLGAMWIAFYPRDTIAKDLIDHLSHEPHAMQITDARVSNELLDGVLRAHNLRLATPLADVSYVQNCFVHGGVAPHLVVQVDNRAVTVILLPKTEIGAAREFAEGEYRGVITPLTGDRQSGAMAVIADDAQLIERVAARVRTALGS